MKLIFYDKANKFVWFGSFQDREVPKRAGFDFNKHTKLWETTDPETAYKLINYATGATAKAIKAHRLDSKKNIALSFVADASIEIPCPKGVEFLPFQKAGVKFAMERKNTLIADPTGVGKTIQALGVANAMQAKRILVVCPAAVKNNWIKEAKSWLVDGKKFQYQKIIAHSGWPELIAEHLFVVINYDIIGRYPEKLADNWDLVVADESHYLKRGDSKRSKAFYNNIVNASRVLFLSATPLKNHPIELWPQIKFLDPKTWIQGDGDKFVSYCIKYCGAFQNDSGYGWTMKGEPTPIQLHELEQILRSTIMLRRPKEALLPELPEKWRQIIELPLDKNTEVLINKENAFWQEKKAAYLALMSQVNEAKFNGEQEYRAAVKKMQEGTIAIFGQISKQRKETALAKVPFMIQFLTDQVEGGQDKIVVFGHHREVLEKMHKAFKANSVLYYGGLSDKQREEALQRFSKDPTCNYFFGSILAAGLGLNELVVANHAVFSELTYVPAEMTQAEDRIHRKGQTHDSVLVQQVTFANSIDARIAKVLVKKQEILDAVLDSAHNSDIIKMDDSSLLKELLLSDDKEE